MRNLEMKNFDETSILKVIISLNIIDREVFFIPQMVVFCLGFMEGGYHILVTTVSVLVFILNQFTLIIYSSDFSFVKNQVNYTVNDFHKYLYLFVLSICIWVRILFGENPQTLTAMSVILSLSGGYLLRNLYWYMHYWNYSMYQTMYIFKICYMAVLCLINIFVINLKNNKSYTSIDIWIFTIYLLSVRMVINLLAKR